MFRLITIDVSGARSTWFKFNHSGYGIMFMDGGTSGFVIRLAFHGNELTESAVYLERGGLIHLPDGFGFDRFFIQHVADAGTVTLAILEKPSKDRPIYNRGGVRTSPLPVAETVNPLPVAETVNPLPVKTEFNNVFHDTIINPTSGAPSDWVNIMSECKLVMVNFTFTTGVTAGNRRAYIVIDEAGTVIFTNYSYQVQSASKSVMYIFGFDSIACYHPDYYLQQSLINTILKATWRFRISVYGIQASDQLSSLGYIKQS